MSRTPDLRFELLVRPPAARKRPWVLPVAAGVLVASLVWAAQAWLERRDVLAAHRAYSEMNRRVDPATPAPLPAYAAEAWAAARLLQTPVDDWLRALEQCHPARARTQSIQVNALTRQLLASVRAPADVDLADWVQCLNGFEPRSLWRVTQFSVDAPPSSPNDAAAGITVSLQRSDRCASDATWRCVGSESAPPYSTSSRN